MINEPATAAAVPPIRAKNPNIDCPDVNVIPLSVSVQIGVVAITRHELTNGYNDHCPHQPLLREECLSVMKKSNDTDGQCSTCDSESKCRFFTS